MKLTFGNRWFLKRAKLLITISSLFLPLTTSFSPLCQLLLYRALVVENQPLRVLVERVAPWFVALVSFLAIA
jgi:hypothetical protein